MDDAGISYAADDSDPAAGATVIDYDFAVGGTDVTIPASVTIDGITYAVTAIGDNAFSESNLTSAVIPDTVITIGMSAFASNEITSLTLGASVTTIGDNAFYENHLESVVIPESVTTLGIGAFSYNALESVIIPESVTSMGTGAFGYNQLESVVIPNTITTIEAVTFVGNRLESIVIPDSVTTIGPYAFYQNRLTDVTIPGSVTSIGDNAFARNRLESVTIPASVTSIGESAFASNRLTSVTFAGDAPAIVRAAETGSFGEAAGKVLYFTISATGFTTPTWQGYFTQALRVTHTIAFDTHEGNPIAPVSVEHGETLTPPADPTRTGYIFIGWFTDPSATAPYDFDAPVIGDFSLHAGWQAVAASGEQGEDPRESDTLPVTGGAIPSGPLLTGLLLLTAGAGALLYRRRHAVR